MTPNLKQLELRIDGHTDLRVSISAPMVEKVSYWFSYKKLALMFGFWSLQSLRVDMIENYKYKDEGLTKEGKDACSRTPHVHVLSLQISAQVCLFFNLYFSRVFLFFNYLEFFISQINFYQLHAI